MRIHFINATPHLPGKAGGILLLTLFAMLSMGCCPCSSSVSAEEKALGDKLVSLWGITTDARLGGVEAAICIPCSGSRRILLMRNSESGRVETIVLGDMEKSGQILVYEDKGTFGLPEVRCGRPEEESVHGSSTFVDFNLDAKFDVFYDVRPKSMGLYISLPSGWVRATAKDGFKKGATTEDKKKYKFDVTTGKWRPMP